MIDINNLVRQEMLNDYQCRESSVEINMRVTLEQIAAIAHHGGLIGFANENECLNEIRRLSLRWWDMAESSRLQVEIEESPKRGNGQ